MKLFYFITKCLFSIICAFAWSGLHAQILSDRDTILTDDTFLLSCIKNPDFDGFGVEKICNSKNEIEIRLIGVALPGGNRSMVMLTCNQDNWDVRKYIYKAGGPWNIITTTKIITESDSMKNLVLKMLFDRAKNEGLFTLPGQGSLGIKQTIYDGGIYQITYKAGNKYRSYVCSNMEGYLEEHPEMTELKKYINIVQILFSIIN